MAHANPLQYWALAVWDKWFPFDVLAHTFRAAATKIEARASDPWGIVCGPTTALIASVRRLGWNMSQPDMVVTDIGQIIDFHLDSPKAIAIHAS